MKGRSERWNDRKITESFIEEGYRVRNIRKVIYDYGTTQTEIEYICSKGHRDKIRLSNWRRGTRCWKCTGIKVDEEDIINSFHCENYKVVSIEGIKSGRLIEYICSNRTHGINKVSWSKWKKGRRCPFCSGSRPWYPDIKKDFEREGYKVITSEKEFNRNRKAKVKCICPKGHKMGISKGNWKQGRRCGECSQKNQTSLGEKEILKLVESLVGNELEVIGNCRSVIRNPLTNKHLELDIWIPYLCKAIEFNGRYWHASEDVKERDIAKIKECKSMGINLKTIKEEDWMENKGKCIRGIKRFVNEII